jgi:excisionase family DNA binding protein
MKLLCSISEAARMMDVGRGYIRELLTTGELKYIKLPGQSRRKVLTESITKLINEGNHGTKHI